MVKITNFWNNRNKAFRTAFTWAIIVQILRLAMWYFNQNFGFSSMSSAQSMNKVYSGICWLEVLMVVFVVIAGVGDLYKGKFVKDDEAVQIAEGVWMIKK